MFRLSKNLRTLRRMLTYHQYTKEASLKSNYPPREYPPQARQPCPLPEPPPPQKPKDDTAFWAAMTAVVVAAGFTVYAKHSPEVRDWLTIYAPWYDDFIAVVYQENMTYEQFARKCVDDAKKMISCAFYEKPKKCSSDKTPVMIESTVANAENEEDEIGMCNEPVEPPIYDICSIVECVRDRAGSALSNYRTALTACSMYNKAVEETMEDFSVSSAKTLSDHMVERRQIVSRAVRCAEDATAELNDLIRYLERGVQASPEEVSEVRLLITEYRQRIRASAIKYQWENDKSLVLDQLWMRVQNGMSRFTQEIESLFPELRYDQDSLKVEGDMDLLLHHVSRYSNNLRRELHEAETGITEKINRNMEFLPQGERRKQRDALIASSIEQNRAKLNKEFQDRYEELKKKNEKILADSLKSQLERHQEDMEKKLEQKEQQIHEKLDRMVAEKVMFEKNMMRYQLGEMAAKVNIVEQKLHASLKAEHEAKRSRELWTAGAALLQATKKGNDYVKVDSELKTIERVADGDKMVATVLKGIPASVQEKGVVPESALKKRYQQMEKTALKVALVEREGGPLPVYFLSWVLSFLLSFKVKGIPQDEYEKQGEVPINDLDTFDLLQRARFWMERGNLAAAIRYVNSLEGASRVAAGSWHEAASAHLETRQAAEALLAYAVSIGLLYL